MMCTTTSRTTFLLAQTLISQHCCSETVFRVGVRIQEMLRYFKDLVGGAGRVYMKGMTWQLWL